MENLFRKRGECKDDGDEGSEKIASNEINAIKNI